MKAFPRPLLQRFGSLGAVLFLLSVSAGVADDITWGNTGTDYNTPENWEGGVLPGEEDTAIFTGTATNQPVLSGAITQDRILFNSAGWELTGSHAITLMGTGTQGSSALAVDGGNTVVSAPLILGAAEESDQWFHVGSTAGSALNISGDISAVNSRVQLVMNLAGGRSATISGNIGSSVDRLTLRGGGTLTLSGNNSYSGGTTLAGSWLALGSANAIGTTGTITFSGGGIQFSAANTTDYSARFSQEANQTYRFFADGQTVTLGAAPMTSVGGSLIKHGAGTLILTALNTFTGNVTTYGGTLSVATIGNQGVAGNLGAGTTITIGTASSAGNLTYTGTGETTNRLIHMGSNGTQGGTLQQDGTGLLKFTGNITSEGGTGDRAKTLTLSGTGEGEIAGVISDAATGSTVATSVTKTDGGIWRLSGANTHTGRTQVSTGTLEITNLANADTANALGQSSNAAANLILNNTTTLRYTGAAASTDRLFTINGASVTLEASGTGAVVFTNPGSLAYGSNNSARNLVLGGTNADDNTLAAAFSNNGSGAGTLNKSGAGTWIVSGTNSYSGATTVSAGTLQFAKTASLYNSVSGSWTAANLRVASGATLAFNVGGAGEFSTGDVSTLLANLAVSNNANNGMNAGSALGFDTTNAAGVFTINDAIADTTGTAGGSRGVVKRGAGTLELAGTNTYTGNTLVQAGTLLISGSTASGSVVTVGQAGTLAGSGIVGGAATIFGTHRPGNSPGIQTFVSDLSYDGGTSAVHWELAANTTDRAPNPGALFDTILVGGDLSFAAPTTLTLHFDGSGSGVLWSDAFWDDSRNGSDGWLLYEVAGTTFDFANLGLTTEDWLDSEGNALLAARPGAVFSLHQEGNDIYLSYAVVPEPSAWALLAFGLVALAVRWRS